MTAAAQAGVKRMRVADCSGKRVLNYLLGLIGHPVSHSLSPPMHEAALGYCGLSGQYKLFDILPENLSSTIKKLKEAGMVGFNVTIPHKDAIFRLVTQHSNEAQRARAVNTVRTMDDGTLLGHNTDIAGFTKALRAARCDRRLNDTAFVLGAGGAARAAVLALIDEGFSRIILIARDPAKGREMLDELKSAHHPPSTATSIMFEPTGTAGGDIKAALMVNATPIGQKSADIPDFVHRVFDKLMPDGLFFDMVYAGSGGAVTPLVELALRQGLNAVNGTDMLVHQALLSFEFWTGHSPSFTVMKDALLAARDLR